MEIPADIELVRSWLGSGAINLFGRPFSGKDTQGHQLAMLFGAEILSGGEILRKALQLQPAKNDSPSLRRIRRALAIGALPPPDDYLAMVVPYLAQNELKGKPLILSSFGRWHGEEEPIISALSDAGHPLKAVVYIKMSDEAIWQRFNSSEKRARSDDLHHVLEVRLEEFRNKTLPVIDFYKNLGELIEVDGEQSRGVVTKEILAGLAKLAGSPTDNTSSD